MQKKMKTKEKKGITLTRYWRDLKKPKEKKKKIRNAKENENEKKNNKP